MYVQYGCGSSAPPEWENFDASATLKWERTPILGRLYTKNSNRFPPTVRYGDIVKGLPVEAKTCKGVYASHVLEHLTLEEFNQAIANTKTILTDRGIFRLVVPDLEWVAREYVKQVDAGIPTANSFFLKETSLGKEKSRRSLSAFVYEWLRTSTHQWMWDTVSMRHVLQSHGFRE
jgi:predicted SAM-dependent methyltransferase